jgi:branched-chain amino acid transport system ATP-binding protein
MSDTPAKPILAVEHLHKSFGGLRVTDDLSLCVAPGEVHGLIGPNGAGKTTLINQISGVLKPDAGAIRFAGHDVTRVGMAKRVRIGLARSFQITTLLPGFTALENVAVAAQAHEGHSFHFLWPAARDDGLNESARECLEAVGLAERADVPAAIMSHGEKRRLEIAVALATRPRLLLLDEPMAGTGPEETKSLVATLQQLRGEMSLLLVEHDMGTVFALADRISVLVYGRLIATGTPEEIRGDPVVRQAYLGEEAA